MQDPVRIVCFGDSITKAYCSRFEKLLKERYSDRNIQVINSGLVSETSVDGLRRLDEVLAHEPNIVIIGFGMNDWRKGVEKGAFKENIELMIDTFAKRDIRTILLTINPDAHVKGKVSKQLIEYNGLIRNIAYEKKIRIADVYTLWMKELPSVETGLYDEIHPNEHVGNQIICEAIMRVVFRSQTVVVWGFNGLYPFCNYSCEYCYVDSDVNARHNFRQDIALSEWHKAFKSTFGNEKLVFYLSYGEPTLSLHFYDVLDLIASEPKWYGHMTSNLSSPLERLVNTKLVKEGRFFINGSFHPTQVKPEKFLQQLLFLRENGIECPIVLVAYPPILKDFERYIQFFEKHGFLVHVRRFRGWYNGNYYPQSYTDDERRLIAKYCDDATIKYMLNEKSVDLKGKLSYEGMYYLLVDENGDVWSSPDSKSKYLGNIFKEDVRMFTEPQPYPVNWNGSVNGIASLLETGYSELTDNFVLSFARQGGVYKTGSGINYKNLNVNFSDPKIRREYGFPDAKIESTVFGKLVSKSKQEWNKLTREYLTRKIYPIVERKRRTIIKQIYELIH